MTALLHAQIQTLRKYQAWRTGKDTRTMDDAGIVPAAVTSALDAVLEIAEKYLRGDTTVVTCQLYGHPLKTRAECNHELACSAEPDVLPGEAIFGFAAWLTSLKTPVTFSECHGAAIGADLAAAYNKSQGFDEIREDFHKRLKPYPEQEPAQPAESVNDCPEDDAWNCKYCRRVNSCPVKHLRDSHPAKPVSVPSDAEIMKPALDRADLAFIYDELLQSGKGRAAGLVRAAILAKHGQPSLPYNLDTDPAKIRALAADAIRGAIGFGIQGTNPPPDGHWLAEFWRTGEALGYTAADMASAAADGFRKGKMSAGEDAARYRTLRAMPPGIRVQVHVGDGEWEDVCSGDELDKTFDSARTI